MPYLSDIDRTAPVIARHGVDIAAPHETACACIRLSIIGPSGKPDICEHGAQRLLAPKRVL